MYTNVIVNSIQTLNAPWNAAWKSFFVLPRKEYLKIKMVRDYTVVLSRLMLALLFAVCDAQTNCRGRMRGTNTGVDRRWSSSVTLVTRSWNINILRAWILLGMSITQFVNSDAININIPHNLIRSPENIFITCMLTLTSPWVRDLAGTKRNGKILLTKNPEIPLFPFKFQKRTLGIGVCMRARARAR